MKIVDGEGKGKAGATDANRNIVALARCAGFRDSPPSMLGAKMSWLALYDGSFPGLLCLAEEALGAVGEPVAVGVGGQVQLTLFDEPRQVVADPGRALAFWRLLGRRLSREALRNLATLHLHGGGGHELTFVRYLRLALAEGDGVDRRLADPVVAEVHRRVAQVRLESHRLKGLVRFRRLRDGSYYGPLRPDHRVLLPVARHFIRRLRQESWLLHDTGRGEALAWDGRELRELALPGEAVAPLLAATSAAEDEAQRLWRMFHDTIAVPGRENPRLQRQFMPRRYWPYLTEGTHPGGEPRRSVDVTATTVAVPPPGHAPRRAIMP